MPLVRLKEYNNKRTIVAHALGTNPSLKNTDLAKKCGVSVKFISTLKKDIEFWELVESNFKNHISNDFLVMDEAMIREAKEGNVQAYRAINEKYGKFIKKFQLEVKSPYELFTNSQKEPQITEYEEISNNGHLPNRNPLNNKPAKRKKQENKKLQKEIKQNKLKIKRREQANIRKRAKKVGLELLKGHTSANKRNNWLKKLEQLEIKEKQKQIITYKLKDIE